MYNYFYQGDILAGILGVSMYWASLGNSSLTGTQTTDVLRRNLVPGTTWQQFTESPYLNMWPIPCTSPSSEASGPIHSADSTGQCASEELKDDILNIKFEPYCAAALFSATVVRRAAALAYEAKGRSTTSPDIIERIGSAFSSLYPG